MKRIYDMTDEEQRAVSREILAALRPVAPEDRIEVLFVAILLAARIRGMTDEELQAERSRLEGKLGLERRS